LADAVIFAERYELRICQGRAKNFRAGPGQFAILYTDRSTVLLQSFRKRRVLRARTSCEHEIAGECERSSTIHFHLFSADVDNSQGYMLYAF
jgi:hypothetical protein